MTTSMCSLWEKQSLSSWQTSILSIILCLTKLIVRGVADGAQRRSSTGVSTATSTYPIPEAPESADQLGDVTTIGKPLWTVADTVSAEREFTEWLGNKVDNSENRREFLHENTMGRLGARMLQTETSNTSTQLLCTNV